MMTLGSLSKAEAARYMGVKGEPDGNVQALLDKYEPIVRGKLRPAYLAPHELPSFPRHGKPLQPATTRHARLLNAIVPTFARLVTTRAIP